MTIGNQNDIDQDISGILFKDWQYNITPNMRGDLVESIVKSILPNNSLSKTILSDRRRSFLLEFAHKIENDNFHLSDSKSEYLLSITNKIKQIRREFEDRRLLRRIDNLDNSMNQNHLRNQTLNTEFRQQIIKKIFNVLCPIHQNSIQRPMIYDVRFLNLIKYAQRIENYCFLKAKTKSNYFQLIAERVQRILVELNFRRSKRQQERFRNQSETQNRNLDDNQQSTPKIDEQTNVLIKTSNLNLMKPIFLTSSIQQAATNK